MEDLKLNTRNTLLASSSLLSTRNNLLVSSLLAKSGENKITLPQNEDKSGVQKRHLAESPEVSSKKPYFNSQNQSLSYGTTSSLSKSIYSPYQTSNQLLGGKTSIFSSKYSKPLSSNLQSSKTLTGERLTTKWTFQTKSQINASSALPKCSTDLTVKQNSSKVPELVESSPQFPTYPDLKIQEEGSRKYNSKFRSLDSNERRAAADLINEKVSY